MKIAIDVSQVVYGTGVSTYTSNLVKNLLEVDNKSDYLLFGFAWRRKQELNDFFSKLKGNFNSKIINLPPTGSEFLFNKIHSVSIDKFIGKVDVIHTSDWVEPKSTAFKVTTVHDLIPIIFPEIADEKLVKVHNRKLNLVKKESAVVIVPSNTTKQDLMKQGIKSNRIKVIPEAVDPIFQPVAKEEIDKVREKFGLDKNYILSVGINKRKNTQNLIDAVEQLELNKVDLVLVGHPHIDLNFSKGVKILGHVDWEDMPALYSGAEVFAYPSLYEGFGLPILEAFACKIPVVTSDLGSMREVAENAAVLIDPRDIDQISNGILKAIKDKDKLTITGQKRVQEYNWKKTAEMTLKVYEEVIQE